MILGFDLLGLASYSIIPAMPRGYALGVFAKEFGNALPNTRQCLAGCSALRVQLNWGGKGHSYDDSPSGLSKVKNDAKPWAELAKSNPGLQVYISPFCEHNISHPDNALKAVQTCIQEVYHGRATNCQPLNSPWKGAVSTNFMNEFHLPPQWPIGDADNKRLSAMKGSGKGYLFSFDGTDILTHTHLTAVKNLVSGAKVAFAWTANFNLHRDTKDPAKGTPPTAKLLKAVQYMLEKPKGQPTLRSGWVWQACDQSAGSRHPNLPFLFMTSKANKVELKVGTRPLATSTNAEPYKGGYRCYFGISWGYELAQQAANGMVNVIVDGKDCGTINPAFQQGDPR